jgi:Kinesin motor domain
MPPARVVVRLRSAPPAGATVDVAQLADPAVHVSGPLTLDVGGARVPFDACCGRGALQDTAYEAAGAPAVLAAMRGQNSAIVVFGGPSSGKKHTGYGDAERCLADGIFPRAVADVMARLAWRASDAGTTFVAEASYFEVRAMVHSRRRVVVCANRVMSRIRSRFRVCAWLRRVF